MLRILLFGPTGMIGEGVLRYLLESEQVAQVVAVSRRPLRFQHSKLSVVLEGDMSHLTQLEKLKGFDACFYCLGASSVGMSEKEYRSVTRDLTLRIAEQIQPGNPEMIFEYVSGAGAGPDATQMWRRVKGETDEAVLAFGFRDAYILRPGFIQPMRGAKPRNIVGRIVYSLATPGHAWLKRRFGSYVTSTDDLASTMLWLALTENSQKILTTQEINAIAATT